MAICKWCGEENPDGVNVCSFCGQDMSIFEDSGLLKNVSQPAQAEAARPRATAGAATAAGAASPAGPGTQGGASMNTGSGAFSAGAVRSAARSQQVQQAQKKAEYVTRNQLKQVAYRLDHKSRSLGILTAVVAVAAVGALALGALALVRSGAQPTDTNADATIAQLQSKVSTLELELQSITAQLEEMQTDNQTPTRVDGNTGDTTGDTTGGSTTEPDTTGNTGVNINESNDPAPDTTPDEPATPSTDTQGGSTIEADTEIDATFEAVDGDGTSVLAVVNQTFEGTTTYQWQKSANLDTWTDVNTSAAKTAKLKISVDDYLRNNSYRCRITNVDSKGVTTVYYTEIVDYNAYQVWSLIG